MGEKKEIVLNENLAAVRNYSPPAICLYIPKSPPGVHRPVASPALSRRGSVPLGMNVSGEMKTADAESVEKAWSSSQAHDGSYSGRAM